jgi:hypothetical protein
LLKTNYEKRMILILIWQRHAVRNFLEKTFKKHPAVAPIIRRAPEFFTSNHVPFFIDNKQ